MAKPVVIFAPALVATPAVYRPLFERLASDFDIRPVEWPRQLPAPLTDRYLFQQIDKAAVGVPRFHLVGQSLSGPVVLKYAARYPGRVSRVIAVAPVLFPFRRLPRSRLRKMKNISAAMRFGLIKHLLESTKEMRRRMYPKRMRILDQWAANINLQPWLGQLPPSTILWHKQEEVIPAIQLDKVRQKFPQIGVTFIPGSHLSIVLEAPRCAPYLRESLNG